MLLRNSCFFFRCKCYQFGIIKETEKDEIQKKVYLVLLYQNAKKSAIILPSLTSSIVDGKMSGKENEQ
jgi:hypothetical protein